MKLSLVVLSEGKASGKSIPITLSQFVIGRDPQCHLRPSSAMISKRHCAVLVKEGKVFLRDFGSTNGTFVNDEPVKGERQLKNDDTLKIGPLTFRVSLQGAPTPVNKPTPPPPMPSVAAGGEEDIAAMLLSLKEEGDGSSEEKDAAVSDVPEGTTMMDIPAHLPPPPPEEAKAPAVPQAPAKPPEKKAEPAKKPASGNTSSAAEEILKKYARRNRTG